MAVSDTDLFAAAEAIRAKAYAPYSQFSVGAAILADDGNIYAGCNIENAAYPQGNCAEASAIAAMIAGGARRIRRIYVTAEQLPRLNGGELAVAQLAGRYLLVTREVALAAQAIDAESLVLLCDPHAPAEDDVPADLVW